MGSWIERAILIDLIVTLSVCIFGAAWYAMIIASKAGWFYTTFLIAMTVSSILIAWCLHIWIKTITER